MVAIPLMIILLIAPISFGALGLFIGPFIIFLALLASDGIGKLEVGLLILGYGLGLSLAIQSGQINPNNPEWRSDASYRGIAYDPVKYIKNGGDPKSIMVFPEGSSSNLCRHKYLSASGGEVCAYGKLYYEKGGISVPVGAPCVCEYNMGDYTPRELKP